MGKIFASGRLWPYAIGGAILLIFGACVATIVVTSKLPVAKADAYMMNYHEADAKANDLINARIEFDKKYKIEYAGDKLSQDGSTIKYKLTDLDGNVVKNADFKVVVTRPNVHDYDQELTDPKIVDGLYVFDEIKLDVPGRWNIMAKVNVGEDQRFYNLKADTRKKEFKEY